MQDKLLNDSQAAAKLVEIGMKSALSAALLQSIWLQGILS